MLSLFKFDPRNTAKVTPVDEDPYLKLGFLRSLPDSIWAKWLYYERTLSYHRTQFSRAMSLLESLAYQEIDAAKQGVLAEFLACCQACPTILVMYAPTDELTFPMTLMENFLEQQYLFTSAGEHAFYVIAFEELLTSMPVNLTGTSIFDYQDEFGFNLLMHVVKHRDSSLLEAYLAHAQVQANMNYDFVDPATHFNVYCVVYGFQDEAGGNFALADMEASVVVLQSYQIRFSVDHLCAILRQVEPLAYAGDPYYNLKRAIYDFCNLNSTTGNRLNSEQYEALQKELSLHACMAEETVSFDQRGVKFNLKGLIQDIAPLSMEDNADKVVIVVTEPTSSTSVFYKAGGHVQVPVAWASSSSCDGGESDTQLPGTPMETK